MTNFTYRGVPIFHPMVGDDGSIKTGHFAYENDLDFWLHAGDDERELFNSIAEDALRHVLEMRRDSREPGDK